MQGYINGPVQTRTVLVSKKYDIKNNGVVFGDVEFQPANQADGKVRASLER